MKQALVVLVILACFAMVGWFLLGQKQVANAADVALDDLPSIQGGEYKVDPYIVAASHLQVMGNEKACQKLQSLADKDDRGARVIVLCRMLFAQKAGADFRRPYIGGASFLADTDYPAWPLEPVELVDGVPFLITRGYLLGGEAESSSSYLKYCMRNCDWSNVWLKPRSPAEKRRALEKLLCSEKWKSPLDTRDRGFLPAQIQ